MKHLFTLLLISLVFIGYAQSPLLVNYQGIARDGSGNPVSSQPISIRYEILQGSPSGPVIYTETQASVSTNSLGLFSTQIGKNSSLAQVNWQAGPYFLQVSMDVSGGSGYVVLGTQQMVSVPFSMHAENVPSTYTNNILSIGSKSYTISSGTAITVSQGTGTNITVSGGPNYTVSYTPPLLALSPNNASLSIVGSNTIALPAAITPTLYPSGIATVTNGASSYTVGVASPAYNQASGILSFGNSNTLVTPTLGLSGGILYSGPFTNSVTLPGAVTVAGTGQATVTGGPNYLVNVAPPALALSANNLSISIVGSNSVALPSAVTVAAPASNIITVSGGPTNYTVSAPAPSYNGTVLTMGPTSTTIAPTLTFNAGTLTSGPASNSVNLSSFGPFTQAGTSVTLSTVSNSVAIGLNSASAKLDVYNNAAAGSVVNVNGANAANSSAALNVSSAGASGIEVNNTSANGIAGNFFATGGYALFSQNNSSSFPALQVNNTNVSGTAAYFKGGIISESKLSGYAFTAKNSSAADIFTIKEDGYVGIGSSSYVAKLDVNGNIRLGNSSGIGQLYFGSVGGVNSGYTGIYNNAADNLIFAVAKSGGASTPFGVANSMDALTIQSQTGNVGIGTATPAQKLEVNGSIKMTDGSQAAGKTLVSDAAGTASWTSSPAAGSFAGLNGSSVNVGTTATNLGTATMIFTKQYASTEVEIDLYSRAYSGIFVGATYISFEIAVDGNAGSAGGQYYMTTSPQTVFISLKSYFAGLGAGTHTITIRAITDGSSLGVLLDSGGNGGRVLVKERF